MTHPLLAFILISIDWGVYLAMFVGDFVVLRSDGGFSQCAVPARLGALHPCPHATVTWSPWEGGTRQYISLCYGTIAIARFGSFSMVLGVSSTDHI